ncbi:T9SS type A sorting domain-containing protein [Gillisia sp. Q332]|uniref:T9SS type A sorting domain-containing protein n=1 Tax=Gillisia xinjiangensis TaxID=3384765 RepID=UPI0039188C62
MKDFTIDLVLTGSNDGKWCKKWKNQYIFPLFTAVLLLIPFNDIFAQKNTAENVQGVAPVITPHNIGNTIWGFEIDGNAKVDTYGDWFGLPSQDEGLSLFMSDLDDTKFNGLDPVFDSNYQEGVMSFFLRDDISNLDPTVFDGSNKIDHDPNTYTWKVGSVPTKNEIQTVAVHFTYGAETHPAWPGGTYTNGDDLWILFAGDREDINGSSYIDFELLQQTLTKNPDGTFTSAASPLTGGRTEGDLLVTLEFTQGGAAAKVVVREWKEVGGKYLYVLATLDTSAKLNGIFASVNVLETIVPWSVYHTEPISTNPNLYQYQINQWAEGAVNLSAFFPQDDDPCFQISTLFIRTRTSGNSGQSVLKDFPGDPIQLNLNLSPAVAIGNTDVSCNGSADGYVTITSASGYDRLDLYKVVGNPDDDQNGETNDTKEDSNTDGSDFSGLKPGSYYVVAVKESGNSECPAISNVVIISDPAALNLAITSTGISCNGANDGILSLDGSANPANDTFDSYVLWKVVGNQDGAGNTETDDVSQGSVTPDGSGVFKSNMSAGTYYVIGKKASVSQSSISCEAMSGTQTFTDPAALNLAITSTGISCNGANDGILSLDGSANPANDTFDSYVLWKVVGNQDGAGNTETDDVSQGSVTPDGSGVFKSNMSAGTYYVIGKKASVSQSSISCEAVSGTETFTEPNCAHIFPTQTDCDEYKCITQSGTPTDFTLSNICLTIRGNKVQNAVPGVFFYYADVIGKAGSTTVVVDQTTDLSLYFIAQNTSNVRVFSNSCGDLSPTDVTIYDNNAGANKGDVSITFPSVEGDSYIISVKYDVKTIVGAAKPISGATANFEMVYDSHGGTAVGGSGAQISLNSDKKCDPNPISDPDSCSSIESSSTSSLNLDESILKSQTTIENGFNAYPVPFRETLNIRYDFDYESPATIQMFDMQGRLLSTYNEANAFKGKVTTINIDFRTRASQIYIVKVTTDRESFFKQIISDK